MQYSELQIQHDLDETQVEILIANLGELGFDSFVENRGELLAYIPTESIDKTDINAFLSASCLTDFHWKEVPEENWNAVWESNYSPVRFGDFCNIRAPFHPAVDDVRFDLIIEPKMSFGTAHHETTSLMIEWLKTEPVEGKRVLDMGCGTGVLAILAKKLGAGFTMAVDNDSWAYENTIENIQRNDIFDIQVVLGDAGVLGDDKFDLIIANINRNILINDMPAYAKAMAENGVILLSGFYESDLPAVKAACEENNLTYITHLTKNNWVAAKFEKA